MCGSLYFLEGHWKIGDWNIVLSIRISFCENQELTPRYLFFSFCMYFPRVLCLHIHKPLIKILYCTTSNFKQDTSLTLTNPRVHAVNVEARRQNCATPHLSSNDHPFFASLSRRLFQVGHRYSHISYHEMS